MIIDRAHTCFSSTPPGQYVSAEMLFGLPLGTIQTPHDQCRSWFEAGSLLGLTYRTRPPYVPHSAVAVVEVLPEGHTGVRLPCLSRGVKVHLWLRGAEETVGHAAVQRFCRFIEEIREDGHDPAQVPASYYRVVGAMLRPQDAPSRFDPSQSRMFEEAALLCGMA